jgi:hypothetical protein
MTTPAQTISPIQFTRGQQLDSTTLRNIRTAIVEGLARRIQYGRCLKGRVNTGKGAIKVFGARATSAYVINCANKDLKASVAAI